MRSRGITETDYPVTAITVTRCDERDSVRDAISAVMAPNLAGRQCRLYRTEQ